MSARQSLLLVLLMALSSPLGMVGMLVADGLADLGFFLLAILPLLIALACAWRQRKAVKGAGQARYK